jgi:hypothetical protein
MWSTCNSANTGCMTQSHQRQCTARGSNRLAHSGAAELGPYRHYMQKEIFEQPRAIADTLEGIEGIVPSLFDGKNPSQVMQPGCSEHRLGADLGAVAPATTAAASPSTGWRASPKFPARWKWPANTATATRCPTPQPWWSPSASRAKPPTPWPPCATRKAWACATP